jgi:hypothetical protein
MNMKWKDFTFNVFKLLVLILGLALVYTACSGVEADQIEESSPLSSSGPAWESFGYINVRDYGAKGDGSTDDTGAILAAIGDAVNTGWDGGVVFFPPGKYIITSDLVVSTNQRLVFRGAGRTRSWIAPHNVALKDGAIVFNGIGNGRLLVEDLYLAYTAESWPGIPATSRKAGIYARDTNQLSIRNSWIASFQRGISFVGSTGTQDSDILNNVVELCEVQIELDNARWVNIAHNTFYRQGDISSGNGYGIKILGSRQIGIKNNRFILDYPGPMNSAVVVRENSSGTTSDNVSIENNSFHETDGSLSAHTVRIEPGPGFPSKAVTVSGNDFYNSHASAIRAANVKNLIVNGNNIYKTRTDSGIQIASGAFGSVVGNSMYQIGRHGIYVTDASLLSITGNSINECSTAAGGAYSGIYLYNSSSCTINANVISGASPGERPKAGIELAGTNPDYNIVTANQTLNVADADEDGVIDMGTGNVIANNVKG